MMDMMEFSAWTGGCCHCAVLGTKLQPGTRLQPSYIGMFCLQFCTRVRTHFVNSNKYKYFCKTVQLSKEVFWHVRLDPVRLLVFKDVSPSQWTVVIIFISWVYLNTNPSPVLTSWISSSEFKLIVLDNKTPPIKQSFSVVPSWTEFHFNILSGQKRKPWTRLSTVQIYQQLAGWLKCFALNPLIKSYSVMRLDELGVLNVEINEEPLERWIWKCF